MLQHHGLLPHRDEHLAQFEVWLAAKLDAIASGEVRGPVEQFATWHHLRRLRGESKPGQGTNGPKRSAKQEITETIKFLTWLEETHGRTAATANEAHNAVQSAEEQLTQVMLQARHAGLSWTKISATLGVSRQAAYQRWAVRLRQMDDAEACSRQADGQSEMPVCP